MIFVGIDIGKNSHYFAAVRKEDGEVIREPAKISNNLKGFEQLVSCIRKHRKQNILIGMEDTGHYQSVMSYLQTRRTRSPTGSSK